MVDILQTPGRTISYFPELTKVTGSIKAAILCQQVTYLTPRDDGADTWISMREHQWIEETGFTLKEFRGAGADLEERKLIKKHYDRTNHVLQIQLQIENYNAAIQELGCGSTLKIAPAKKSHAKTAHAKTAHAKKAHAKREDGIDQKGTCHVPKGNMLEPSPISDSIGLLEAEGSTEGTTETTTPLTPQVSSNEPTHPSGGNVGQVPRTKKEYSDYPGFCELWDMAVVRPGGSKGVKQEALTNWKKLHIETNPSLLSRVLEAYAYQKTTGKWQEEGGVYVKELQRWIKGALWEGVTVPEGFDRTLARASPVGFDQNGYFAQEVARLEREDQAERERQRAGN